MEPGTDTPFAIDADGHVIEPNEAFQNYLPERLRARAPRYQANESGKFRFFFDGEAFPPFPDTVSIRKPMEAANRSEERRVGKEGRARGAHKPEKNRRLL